MALRPRIKRKTGSASSKKKTVGKRIRSKKRVVKKALASRNQSTNKKVQSMSANRETELARNYSFLVELGGDTRGAFSQVSGLESTTDVITYRDGSDLRLSKRPGRTHYSNIILYRGVSMDDSLWQWRKEVIDGLVPYRDGSIILLNESYEPVVRYNFTGGWPCRWKSSGLDALGNETVIEELEIVIDGLARDN